MTVIRAELMEARAVAWLKWRQKHLFWEELGEDLQEALQAAFEDAFLQGSMFVVQWTERYRP